MKSRSRKAPVRSLLLFLGLALLCAYRMEWARWYILGWGALEGIDWWRRRRAGNRR